jgi:dTDP-4-dehydrorhamnose 3,5-epimerase-like enzyme
VFQNGNNIPFDIKRVFFIHGTKNGITRGHHAHYKTRQLLVATSGSVKINCEWNREKKSFILDKPNKALLIDGMVWHTMDEFSSNCVLMVIADTYYDESDYIRDYDEFLKEVANAEPN